MFLKRLICAAALLPLVVLAVSGQSDWNTYPMRSIAQVIDRHSGNNSPGADLIISADPFPSKTVLTYTGQHRSVDQWKKYFINLWAEARNLPPENPRMLMEEYLFREKDKEYWVPVVKTLAPNFQRELKLGDEIIAYYFFLGGYNERTLREKEKNRREAVPATVANTVTWVFAIEEYQKPSTTSDAVTGAAPQLLAAVIDKTLTESVAKEGLILDPRQIRSKTQVIFTGEQRRINDDKRRFLVSWLESRSLPVATLNLLEEEVLFRQRDKDYWMPVRKKTLESMLKELNKGAEITIHTILAGGIKTNGGTEWVFIVGEFAK